MTTTESEQLRLETFVVDCINRTLYQSFALMGFSEMFQMGLADMKQGWDVESYHSAVVARIGDEVIGILTFDPNEFAYIKGSTAYVLPDYRRRGILGAMIEELVKWAERNDRRQIEFEVPIQNVAAGKALVAYEARVVSQRYRINL